MARPRRSTVDELIDLFDSFDLDVQERVMDQLQLVQRLAKKRAAKTKPAEPEEDPDGQIPISEFRRGA